jgi:uncharacterized membrane protein YphA (DoxX/SURF4 family)
VAALIMLQTLFFKFTAAAESVEIFTRIGVEPWGRIGVGFMELIASVLICIPVISWMGALLAVGIMSGAVFFHITVLGLSVRGDGGHLFGFALTTLIAALIVLYIRKSEIPFINKLKF